MAMIRILDDTTANQIAAGEVVERPSSVVKELVENSLDAGATRIVVEVEGGGRDLIRVSDDGCGMSPEDARLCIERHATSKIASGQDLTRIHTLGFRGEALPSIAAVSRFELRTRPRADLSGTRVVVEGGQVLTVDPCGCAPGTRIEVRDLFYNTPARLKYLKTNATELGRINDALGRLALAHPQVSIRYRSGPLEVLATPGRGQLLDAVAAVLGRELAREMVPLEFTSGACRVTGYTALPSAARAGRALQHFIVNGRPVQAFALRYALEEAYTNLIPQGRYPVCVVHIEVDPEEVDVNVHPAKLEVRFQREREVRGAVYRAVQAALGAHMTVPGTFAGPEAAAAADAAVRRGPSGAQPLLDGPQPGRDWVQAGRGIPAWARPAQAPGQTALPTDGAYAGTGRDTDHTREAPDTYRPLEGELAAPGDLPLAGEAPRSPAELIRSLRPLGQIHRTYLACDGPEGLYLIDQHAAHERIFFERFLRAAAESSAPIQPLLFPLTVELTAVQAQIFQEYVALFAASGLEVEPFGGRTVMVKGIPSGVPEAAAARLITDFIDKLIEETDLPANDPLDRRRRVSAAMAACKAAIKAKDALHPEEMAALLSELAACENPGQCPHGRPTIILFRVGDLERRFGRA